MDFRRLLEGDCGQVNPVTQLATHVTNQLEQEHINENAMVPNTFNMNEIIAQLQNVQSPISMVPPGSLTHNQSFYVSPLQEHTVRLQQNINLPVNQLPAHLPSGSGYHHHHHQFQLPPGPSLIEAEEYQRLEKDIAEAQAILNGLEEDENVNEEQVSKSEAESSKNILNQPKYLTYDHLSVEDVYGISDMRMNDAEYLYNFVENYVLKNSSRKYQKYLPQKQNELGVDEINSTTINFRNIILKNRPIHNYYIKWSEFNYVSCGNLREELTRYLASKEQYYDVITVCNYISRNCICCYNRHIRENVYFSIDAYLHEQCFYQACQMLFNWFKREPDYRDIVEPNFVMEDKTETNIDKDQLRALTKMFVKAAQRNPSDLDLQIYIAKLCEIDQDYGKAIDCYQTILTRDMDGVEKSMYISMCLGKSFALCNKLIRAERIFRIISNKVKNLDDIVESSTHLGIIFLYRKCYVKAAVFLFDAVRNQLKLGHEESDHVKLENSLSRLRLCFELMRRDDLCEVLDSKDYHKVQKLVEDLNRNCN